MNDIEEFEEFEEKEEWEAARCAQEWGVQLRTWHGYVARNQAPGPIYHLGRTPIWDAHEVRRYPRGQGRRTDLMPATMPIFHQVMVGSRDTGPFGPDPEPPAGWYVSVAERVRLDDTLMEVVTPQRQVIAEITWSERLAEDDAETIECAEWLVAAARQIWEVAPRLVAGTPPAALWDKVADAWKHKDTRTYHAWAGDVYANGGLVTARL